MAKITKSELAELLASDARGAIHSASYYAERYTIPELEALVEAYGFANLHSREARQLFDAVAWSRSLRTNSRLRSRVNGRKCSTSESKGILR
jgi:hypothetical protein